MRVDREIKEKYFDESDTSFEARKLWYAFKDAIALETITIPASVTYLGDSAFKGCTSLSSVYFKSPTPPSWTSASVFDNNATGRKIYVPIGARDAYLNSADGRYKAYADDIVEKEF